MIAPCEDVRCPCETGTECSFTVAGSYAEGLRDGLEHNRADDGPRDVMAELRRDARRAETRTERAYVIGYLRGLRLA